MLRKLREYLTSLINSAQHGFIPGRSCTTQLVEVLHYIGSILDSGKQTDMIFMDMSKAFDKVSHTALINKLRQYKIGGPLLHFCLVSTWSRTARYHSWRYFFQKTSVLRRSPRQYPWTSTLPSVCQRLTRCCD